MCGLKKRGVAEFFDRLGGVWISDETLRGVFDKASLMSSDSSSGYSNHRIDIQTTDTVLILFFIFFS